MENNIYNTVDRLLEAPCYIIDVLPFQVPESADGQFFDVEYYLLNSNQYGNIKDRFVRVILKLMCYHHVKVIWNGVTDRPSPDLIDTIVYEIMNNHSGTLQVLLPEEETLIVFDWDCLYLSVYNPSEKMKHLLNGLAFSEGLFWRKSDN